jgi:hypothetical protein
MIQQRKLFLRASATVEADAIDGNGTLRHHVAHHVVWREDFEHPILARLLPADNAADAVDVAGNQMTVEAATGLEGALQIHQGSFVSKLEISASPRFRGAGQNATIVSFGPLSFTTVRQQPLTAKLAPGSRDFRALRRLDGKLYGFLRVAHRDDLARFFNDPGKHSQFCRSTARSQKQVGPDAFPVHVVQPESPSPHP